ncbi:MAG TPA: hypothetical protein VG889_08460 [Rhizomicrobium sp.]|nr:hypothetical protein [Rhizomicrobium sp.]
MSVWPTSNWDEMLDEFRALGGTASNIRLGAGALGRGIFPIEPAKSVTIRIPDNLLIDTADAHFENGIFRVRAEANVGSRERAFLEDYENRFSWGGGGRAETEQVFADAQALPASLRRELAGEYRCGAWFEEPTQARIQEQFVASRCISYRGRSVIMPIVELVNHGAGVNYDTNDGLKLAGKFGGEVLVRYTDLDPYGLFLTWGFAYEQRLAFSIALAGNVGEAQLEIGRDIAEFSSPQAWVPRLARSAGGGALDFLMIGNSQYPRLCRGIFYKVMHEAGLAGFEEAFDTIQHVNRTHFLNLLAALEGVKGPMAKTLSRMARHQLTAMSFSFGVRAV